MFLGAFLVEKSLCYDNVMPKSQKAIKNVPKEKKALKEAFVKRYNNLNKEQKEAVEAIEGPVMVIAGPGTGKTEILTLRIANILKKTDTPASGVLALTFTNSGVKAMRERLVQMMGSDGSGVTVTTFHSFAISIIQEFYEDLNFPVAPALLDDSDRVVLYDELLENHPWQYLRSRVGGAHNFGDLRSVISLLKQEKISPKEFLNNIDSEIFRIQNDPESISTRGPTKGNLKATELEKIERFERTKEIGAFYGLYDKTKKERDLADYDDVLNYIVELVQRSENARAAIRERYLYVLVDEHQDSSGVQNSFLEEVWSDVEQPNVFVVGDDRQLIYGFGGASLEHFENFQKAFPGTQLIVLTQNYRSTQRILDVAQELLESSIVKADLVSNTKENHPIRLIEAEYPRDEILRAGLEIKKKIEEGTPANECAILVPKNSHVKSAAAVLADLGLPVASGGKVSFFSLSLTQSLIRLLRVLADPYAPDRLANIILDSAFEIPFLVSQKFLREHGSKLSLEEFSLGHESIVNVGELISELASFVPTSDIYELIQKSAQKLFLEKASTNAILTQEVEVTRTILHLALENLERNPKITLEEFIEFLSRMEEYGQDISLAVFGGEIGVQVRTLHTSKGLEFDYVWIAHLDEASLMKGKQLTVTLPANLKEKIATKDEITAKRELYVGITRAKRFCTLSYAKSGYSGATQYLAKIIAGLPEETFERSTAEETEKYIRLENEMAYVKSTPAPQKEETREEIIALVKEHYNDRPVSVTHLNNFFSCPWKWYFRNFLLLPEPISESLDFGNLVHGSIETIIKSKEEKISLDELIPQQLDQLRIYNEKKRARLAKDGKMVLDRFIVDYLPEFKDAFSEKKSSRYRDMDIPEVEISGKIDIIKTLPDGTLSVTDFKTGKVKTKREIEKRKEDGRMSDLMRQLTMYSYLLLHEKFPKTGSTKVSISQLLFLEAETGDTDAVYQTEIKVEEIELLRKDIRDFVDQINTGEWVDCVCDFKPFGHQKECEYCEFAKNINLKS